MPLQRSRHKSAPGRLLAVLVLAAQLCACGDGAGNSEAAREPPASLLLVVLDSLHAAHTTLEGYTRATTPHLERLAAEGVYFGAASSQSSWTLPSVASLFSGQEQERHGLRHLDARLGDEPTLLAELFAAAGWRTAAVVQTPVLGSARGLARGFESYSVLAFGNQASELALERTLALFAEGGEQPLFCYLHLAPPHMPYQPPAPFAGRFSAGADPGDPVDGSIESCRTIHRAGLAPEHPDCVRLAALYDEHVAYADALLGRLLAGLAELPAARDLLVVATSDHGEAFGQHGAQGHNAQVYQEMLHVPLVFSGRGRARLPAGRVDGPVSLLDVLPTLVELYDLPQPAGALQGLSLVPALRGVQEPALQRDFFHSSRYRRRFADLELGLRSGDLKLVLSGSANRALLFDLARDPGETRDISAQRPEERRVLEARLRAWYAARAPDAARVGPVQAAEADPELAAQLRALGYTQD